MNAQARRAIRAAALLAAAILLASCVSPELYAPPLEGEPAAWIKLQYVYRTSKFQAEDTRLRVTMFIREEQEEYYFRPAYNQSYNQSLGLVLEKKMGNPRVPMHAMRIRSVENTAIRMRLGFEWWWEGKPCDEPYEWWESCYQVFKIGCSATQQFNPEPDKVYLVSYTTLSMPTHCAVAIFLQTPTGNGTFKLEPVGEPYVE
jgi:hypothetical protein